MSDLPISPELVGQRVRSATRPEWGEGTVLRVQRVQDAGRDAWRVSVQFKTGHRTLLVPPARLTAPTAEPERAAPGWLDSLSRGSLDERLVQLPESVTDVLGTPVQRLRAVFPLYAYDDSPNSLVTWARRQADVADPLSHWNRDELSVAFDKFCQERDSHFRALAARIVQNAGRPALDEALSEAPSEIRPRLLAALQRII